MKVFIIFVLLASILRCLVMGNETDIVEVLRRILDEMNNKSIAREEASKQEMKDFVIATEEASKQEMKDFVICKTATIVSLL